MISVVSMDFCNVIKYTNNVFPFFFYPITVTKLEPIEYLLLLNNLLIVLNIGDHGFLFRDINSCVIRHE